MKPKTTRKANSQSHTTLAWALILVTWLCTPFIGDRLPAVVYSAYGVLVAFTVIFGLYVVRRTRSIPLAIAAIITAFSWVILLVVGLALFGV